MFPKPPNYTGPWVAVSVFCFIVGMLTYKGMHICAQCPAVMLPVPAPPVNQWRSYIIQSDGRYSALVIDDRTFGYSFVMPYRDTEAIGCLDPLFVSTKDSAQLAADRWIKFYTEQK